MSAWPRYPVVYEVNAWVWLQELSQRSGQRITFGSVPRSEVERLAALGLDGVWLMGIWMRSPASRRVGREHPGLQQEFRRALPDLTVDDVIGSPYAVYNYSVDTALGDREGLALLRERLAKHGIRLVLDFVPNHLAVDHAWVREHPERFVQGSEGDLAREPDCYFQARSVGAEVLAHGRDPNFAGWSDTVQLDYRMPETRQAMRGVLSEIASKCDGVRCDMAMLILHDVFLRTWGGAFEPQDAQFWTEAIGVVRARMPGFLFLAEAYWDLGWRLQQLGFDYTYDKRLYDCLLSGDAESVRGHLGGSLTYQQHLARFLENHDERRAADAFGPTRSRAAAVIALTLPGLRLLHQGQLEGRRARVPVQLGRRMREEPDASTVRFYRRLLAALSRPIFHSGEWRLLEPVRAWPENTSHRGFVAHRWMLGEEYRLVVANLSANQGQCFVRLDVPELAGAQWILADLVGDARYVRQGDDLRNRGLYIDMVGYGYHVLAFERA